MEENKIDLVEAFKKAVARHDIPGFAWIAGDYIRISMDARGNDIQIERMPEERCRISYNTLEQEITIAEFKELYDLAKEEINHVDADYLKKILEERI